MLTRRDVLSRAADDCMKELYSLAQPHIEWDDFIKENEIYSKKYKTWEGFNRLYHKKDKSEKELEEYSTYPTEWKGKSINECIGPPPFEFYYLPREVMKDICDNYVRVYKIDTQQELLDTIEVLKNYCKKPIIDVYIKEKGKIGDDDWEPGHREYEYPDNLRKEISKYISERYNSQDANRDAEEIQNIFFKFLDMAGNFYNWNGDLNAFNMTVYLGCSPNSNKEAVIKNWKEYRDKDIEIDESKYNDDEYDE